MLIGGTEASRKMSASATTTAEPPTTSGTPAATTEPKTSRSASAARGREMSSARRRSLSGTDRGAAPVEGGPAGEEPLDARHLPQRGLDRGQGLGGIVGRQVQRDDLVDRAPVGADLARRQQGGLGGRR